MPHLGSGITFDWNGRRVMASPNLKEGLISVIDMKDWETVKQIPTLGPGFFMRSHEATPYAWTDSMMSKAKDTLQVIDKRTLETRRRGEGRRRARRWPTSNSPATASTRWPACGNARRTAAR